MCDLKHLTEPDAARSWFRMQDAAEFGQSGNAAEEESPRRAAWPGASKAQLLRTRYMDMLLHVDEIPRLYNMLAAFFTWILLAGFIVFPGTYTTLEHNVVVKQAANGTSYLEEEVVETAMSISVLWVAGVCCAVGASGTGWLWIKWRKNYVWVVNRIFLTGLFNSAAGFLGTMVNVYTVRKGHYSTTAKVTAIVTGTCTFVFAVLFFLNTWLLGKVREHHEKQMRMEERAANRIERRRRRHQREARRRSPADGSQTRG